MGADLNTTTTSGFNLLRIVTLYSSPNLWEYIVEFAKDCKLSGISARDLHEGHTIWDCFKDCRCYFYQGARDMEEEEMIFKEMIKVTDINT